MIHSLFTSYEAGGLVADLLIRGFVWLTAAGIVYTLLRRFPAAARHRVLTTGAAGLLLLPALYFLTPEWALRFQTVERARAAVDTPANESTPHQSGAPAAIPGALAGPAPSPHVETTPLSSNERTEGETPIAATSAPVRTRVWWAWGIGSGVCVFYGVLSHLALFRLRRRAHFVTESAWLERLQACQTSVGIRRPVRLVRSADARVPMTWGLFRPVVCLPESAENWSRDCKDTVLLHELEHVKRWDTAIQALAQLARAVHWANPLAWWLTHALIKERERACDEAVVSLGMTPSAYAEHLVTVARSLRRRESLPGYATVAMASKRGLENRIRGLLNAKKEKRPMTRTLTVTGALVAMATIGILAALRPGIETIVFAQNEHPEISSLTFESGARVDLLAICHPSEEQCWAPNGAELPYPPADFGFAPTDGNEDAVQFAFHVVGPTDFRNDLLVTFLAEDQSSDSGPEYITEGLRREIVDRETERMIHAVIVPDGADIVRVRIASPTDQWEGIRLGVDGSAVESETFGVTSGQPIATQTGVSVTVSDTAVESFVRLFAVDQDGLRRPAKCRNSVMIEEPRLRQATYEFESLDADQIDSFWFETNEGEVAEFHNVPLQPGVEAVRATLARREMDELINKLKQIGLAMKMFANESRGEVYPEKQPGIDIFQPSSAQLWPEYIADEEIRDFIWDNPELDIYYFGHAIPDEVTALRLLDAYEERGDDVVRNQDVPLDEPIPTNGLEQILRLREGIERFFITDINNPAGVAQIKSNLPIFWVLPKQGAWAEAPVLYLDGHVAKVPIGEFPLTSKIIEGVAALRGDRPAKPLAKRRGAPSDREISSLSNNLKQLGLGLKMYANEQRGEKWPPKAQGVGLFLPDRDALFPEYIPDSDLAEFIWEDTGHQLIYFGHAIRDEATLLALLRAYKTQGDAIRDEDVKRNEPIPTTGLDTIFRIREGIERFFITDINDPNQLGKITSSLPVAWILPLHGNWTRVPVLYLDGHVETVPMGQFPLTAKIINGLSELRHSKAQRARFDTSAVAKYELPFAITSYAFEPGDEIMLHSATGNRPRLEVGGTYRVTGRYSLASHDSARLLPYATNGETTFDRPPDVLKGSGEFERTFKLTKMGRPHLSFYPSGGGNGFGDLYYALGEHGGEPPKVPINPIIKSTPTKHVPFKTVGPGEFKGGDRIKITRILGTREKLEVGGKYTIEGEYTLRSHSDASLHVFASGGEVASTQGPVVTRGTGQFTRTFTYLRDGSLHLSFYSTKTRQGFGGLYFADISTTHRRK